MPTLGKQIENTEDLSGIYHVLYILNLQTEGKKKAKLHGKLTHPVERKKTKVFIFIPLSPKSLMKCMKFYLDNLQSFLSTPMIL